MKSFLRWIESEEFPGVSEPQHKKGEDNESLSKVVENRIKSIILDLGPDGKNKGTREKILAAVADCVKKMGVGNEQQGQQPQGNQGAPADPNNQGGAPAATQPQGQPQQAPSPVAVA
jgi:hypothetical protein